MSKEPEKKAAEQGGSEIEYAFGRVPMDKRKKFSTILVILVGYCISLSNFVTGATVGSKMSFSGTVWSIVVGNAILAFVAVMVGIIGAKSGKTTLVLARNFLGKRSSAIMSVLIALSAINWIAVNANTFADMVLTNFTWWPLPMWATAIIVVAIWAQSAIRGVKGLEIVSWLGAPAAVILAIASFIAIGTKTGFGAVVNYVPGEGQLTFAAGSTSIVGAWIFGCIVTPDVTRYAKHGKHVALAAPIAVYVGLAMIELVGAMTAQATGNASFVAATAALGLGILVFLCAIFCVWTTQDNNIYSASLSLQNIFVDTKLEGKIKHSVLAIIVAVLSAAFAAAGAVKYLLPIIKALSVLLPPIPAMMIAEQWCVKNSKENQAINWVGILSWAISTVIGQICINHNFLIPAVVSMIVAFFLYWGLSKALDKSWNKDATGKAE